MKVYLQKQITEPHETSFHLFRPVDRPGFQIFECEPRYDSPKSEREELCDKAERLVRDWFEGGLSEPEVLTEQLVDLFEIDEGDDSSFESEEE